MLIKHAEMLELNLNSTIWFSHFYLNTETSRFCTTNNDTKMQRVLFLTKY